MGDNIALMMAVKEIRKQMPLLKVSGEEIFKETYVEFQVPILTDLGTQNANNMGQNTTEGQKGVVPMGIPAPLRGKILMLNVVLTNEFPNKPPSLCLGKKLIYHPFIGFDNGSVCMDVRSTQWKPEDGVKRLIQLIKTAIPTLLGYFEGENPHNWDAFKEVRENYEAYEQNVGKRFQTAPAGGCLSPYDLAVKMVKEEYTEYPKDFATRANNLGICLFPLDKVAPNVAAKKDNNNDSNQNGIDWEARRRQQELLLVENADSDDDSESISDIGL